MTINKAQLQRLLTFLGHDDDDIVTDLVRSLGLLKTELLIFHEVKT